MKEIKNILLEYCPRSYFWRALPGYPKLEYNIRILHTDIVDKYILTLHAYDKGTYQTINELADTLDDEVGQAEYEADGFYFKFYKNDDRQPIDEAEKDIAHLMWSYEIRLFWKGEIIE